MSLPTNVATAVHLDTEFKRGLDLYASTMVVVGSMIGSGIFLVSAEMGRQTGSPGLLLTAWVVTGVLTVAAALSYGELAAMMPRAGGQYVYLRQAFGPLSGFLYGWTLFTVIQTGTIAAVAVGFARYTGYLLPWFSEEHYLIGPLHVTSGFALSLSTVQLLGIVMVALLTWTNTRGLHWGRLIQNVFTTVSVVCTHFPSRTPRRFTHVRSAIITSATRRCGVSPSWIALAGSVQPSAAEQMSAFGNHAKRSGLTVGQSTPRNRPNATATAAMVPVWITTNRVHP